MENALESALEEEHFATLALVSTGEVLREWTYYAKCEREFVARLNYASCASIPDRDSLGNRFKLGPV
jgi:hypothetical protein